MCCFAMPVSRCSSCSTKAGASTMNGVTNCNAVAARFSCQLVRREAKPRRIPANEFLLRLAPTLRKKAHNYKERGMDLGELDIIAFASLKREVLDLNSHFPPPTEYLRQGWRSLSLVGPTFARVLFAHPDAPDFLRSNLGRSIVFDVGISL